MIAACLLQQSVGYLLTSPLPTANQGLVARSSGAVNMMASPLADIAATSRAVRVEGDTLKTWDIGEEAIERVQLDITSDGRPCHADVQLWHTPAYIPTKFSVYTEDGNLRPVTTIIETPKHPKTVAVYNTGPQDFPFSANVANTLYQRAGVGPTEIDVAQLYDCFTTTVLVQLEDYGFCAKGEGGPFAESGAIDIDGEVPINTAGGNLSEGYIHGLNHVVEGVRQIRGSSTAQVDNAEMCLVTSGLPPASSAMILETKVPNTMRCSQKSVSPERQLLTPRQFGSTGTSAISTPGSKDQISLPVSASRASTRLKGVQ